MQSLFLKEVADYETSNYKLPNETAEWDEAIIGKFLQKVPKAEKYIIKPKYTHLSEETGTAVGAIYIVEQAKRKMVAVPIIVKRFSLYPLDVLMVPTDKEAFTSYPLTPDKFEEHIANADTFDYLDKSIDRIQQLYFNPEENTVYPPQMRNTASTGMLDAISSTITPAQKTAFFDELRANKTFLVGYEKRANLDVLTKIASAKYIAKKASIGEDPKLIHLKCKGDGDIIVTSLDSQLYNPIIDFGRNPSVGDDPIVANFSPDTLNDVMKNGEKILSKIDPVTGVSLYNSRTMLGPNQSPTAYGSTDGAVIPASSFAAFKVQDVKGIYHRGVVFPDVMSFDQKKIPMKVFYNSNCYSYQSDMAGVLIGNVGADMLEFGEPCYGMTGVFVFTEGTKAVVTVPILIKGVANYDDESVCIKAVDAFGKPLKIRANSYGKEIVKIKGEYLLPSYYKFLPMSNFKELAERVSQIQDKVSSRSMDANPIRLLHTGHGQFSLKGPDLKKMASLCNWDTTNLSYGETAFLLSAKRCPMNLIRESIKIASTHSEGCSLHGLPTTKYSVTKKASAQIKPVSFLKEASYMEDAETVDTLLSLSFINSENIKRFSDMIPIIEYTQQKLAQLLLASRMGMTKIPEGATATAMYKLVEIVGGLEKLKLQEDNTGEL